jgi:hypothetical protein
VRLSPSVFEIDPRRFGRDKLYLGCLIGFWIVWFPITVFATILLFNDGPLLFLLLWCTIAWLGVVTIPLALAQRNRKQILTVAGDRLLVTGVRPFSRRPVELHRDDLVALTLEHYGSVDSESVYTLNLIQTPLLRYPRIMLAPFVRPYGKARLFEELAGFLADNGFDVELRNRWTPGAS